MTGNNQLQSVIYCPAGCREGTITVSASWRGWTFVAARSDTLNWWGFWQKNLPMATCWHTRCFWLCSGIQDTTQFLWLCPRFVTGSDCRLFTTCLSLSTECAYWNPTSQQTHWSECQQHCQTVCCGSWASWLHFGSLCQQGPHSYCNCLKSICLGSTTRCMTSGLTSLVALVAALWRKYFLFSIFKCKWNRLDPGLWNIKLQISLCCFRFALQEFALVMATKWIKVWCSFPFNFEKNLM